MIALHPILASHAEALFPLVFRSSITNMLIWDGPDSLEDLRNGLRVREEMTRAGQQLIYVMLDETGAPVGSIGLVPDHANAAASLGLWIGEPFHGRGYGTQAVRMITQEGLQKWDLERLEARVFVGNFASRRIFEKNNFILEGTLRRAVRKRGVFLDEWVLASVRGDDASKREKTSGI